MDDPRGGASRAPPGAPSSAGGGVDDGAGRWPEARADVGLGGPPWADASDSRGVAASAIASGTFEHAARGRPGGSEGFGPQAPSAPLLGAPPLPEPGVARTAGGREVAGAARPGSFPRTHPPSARLVSQPLSHSTPGFVLAYAPVHPALAPPFGLPPLRPAGCASADAGLAEASGASGGRAAAAPSERGGPYGDARDEWRRVPQVQGHHAGLYRPDEAGAAPGFGGDAWSAPVAPAAVGDLRPVPPGGRGLPSPYVIAGAAPLSASELSGQAVPGAGWGASPQQWPMLQQSSSLRGQPSSQHPPLLLQRPSTQLPLQFQHSSSMSQATCFQQSPSEDFAPVSWSLPPSGTLPGLRAPPHLPPPASARCETPQWRPGDGCAFSEHPHSVQSVFPDARAGAAFGRAGGPSPESRVLVDDARGWEDGRGDRLGAPGPLEYDEGPSGRFFAAPAASGVVHPSQAVPAQPGERDVGGCGPQRFESPRAPPQLAAAPAWPYQPYAPPSRTLPDPFPCAPSETAPHLALAPFPHPHALFFGLERGEDAPDESRSFAPNAAALASQPRFQGVPFAYPPSRPSAGGDAGDVVVDQGYGAGVALGLREASSGLPVALQSAPMETLDGTGALSAFAGAAAGPRTDGRGGLAPAGAGEAGGASRGDAQAVACLAGGLQVAGTSASQRRVLENPPIVASAAGREEMAAVPSSGLSAPPSTPGSRISVPRAVPASALASSPAGPPHRLAHKPSVTPSAVVSASRYGASPVPAPASAPGKSTSSRPSVASAPARLPDASRPPAPSAGSTDPSPLPSPSGATMPSGDSKASLEEQRKARAREYNRLAQARFRANLREKRRKAAEEDEASRWALELARTEHAALIAQRDLLERLLVFRDDCAKVLDVAAKLAEEGGGSRFRGGGRGAFCDDGRRGAFEGELGGVVGRWMGAAGRFSGSAQGSWLGSGRNAWNVGAATWGGLPTSYLVPEEHGAAAGAPSAGPAAGNLDDAPRSSRDWEGSLDWASALVGSPGALRRTIVETPSEAAQRAILDAPPAAVQRAILDAPPAAVRRERFDAPLAAAPSGGATTASTGAASSVDGAVALRSCAPPEIHDTASPTSSAPAPPVHALFEAVRKLQLPELRGLTPGQRAWFDAVFFMISENEFAIPADEELAQADVESLTWHFQLLGLQFARERRLMVLGENGSIGVEATDASRPGGGNTTLDVVAAEHASEFVTQVVGRWVMVDDEEERKKKKRPGKGSQGSPTDSASGSGSRAGSRPCPAAAPEVTSLSGAEKGSAAAARSSTSAALAPREPQTAQFSHHQPERQPRPPTATGGDEETTPGADASGDGFGTLSAAAGPGGTAPGPLGESLVQTLPEAVAVDSGRTVADAGTPDAADSVRSRPSSDAAVQGGGGSVGSQCSRGLARGLRPTSLSRALAASAEGASPSSSLVSPTSAESGQAQSASSTRSATCSSKVPPSRGGRGAASGGQAMRPPEARSRPSSSNDSSRPDPGLRLPSAAESDMPLGGYSASPSSAPVAAAEPRSPSWSSSASSLSSPRSPPEGALPLPLPLSLALPSLNPDIVTPLMSDLIADDAGARDSGSVSNAHPDSAASGSTGGAAAGSGDAASTTSAAAATGASATPTLHPIPAASGSAASSHAVSVPRSLEAVLSTPLPVLGALGPEGLERILRETPELEGIAEILFSDGRGPAPLRGLLSALSTGMFKSMTLRDLIGTDPGLLVSLGIGGASVGGAGGERSVAALAAMLGERARGAAPGGGVGGDSDVRDAPLGPSRPCADRPCAVPIAPLSNAAHPSPPPSVASASFAPLSARSAVAARDVDASLTPHPPPKAPLGSARLAPPAQVSDTPASLAVAAEAPADPLRIPPASARALAPTLGRPSAAPAARSAWTDAAAHALWMEVQDPEETLHNEYLVGRSMALMALSRQGESLSLEPAASRPDVGAEWSPLAREARAQVLRLMRTLLERRPEDVVPVFRGKPEDVAAAEGDPEHWRRAVRGIGLRPLQKVAIADLAVRVRLALEAIMRRRKRALEGLLRVLKDERLPDIQTGAARSARAFALLGLCRDTLSDERAVWMHVYARIHRIADSRQMLVLRMLAWPCHTDLGRLLDVVFEDVARERVAARERLATRRRRSKARAARAVTGAVVGETDGGRAGGDEAVTATPAGAAIGVETVPSAGAETSVKTAVPAVAATTSLAAASGPAASHLSTRRGKRRSFGEGIRRAFEAGRMTG